MLVTVDVGILFGCIIISIRETAIRWIDIKSAAEAFMNPTMTRKGLKVLVVRGQAFCLCLLLRLN